MSYVLYLKKREYNFSEVQKIERFAWLVGLQCCFFGASQDGGGRKEGLPRVKDKSQVLSS